MSQTPETPQTPGYIPETYASAPPNPEEVQYKDLSKDLYKDGSKHSICKRFSDQFMEELLAELEEIDNRFVLSKDECSCNEEGFSSKSKHGYPVGFFELAKHFKLVSKSKGKKWNKWSNEMKKVVIDKVVYLPPTPDGFPEYIRAYFYARLEYDAWIYQNEIKVRKMREKKVVKTTKIDKSTKEQKTKKSSKKSMDKLKRKKKSSNKSSEKPVNGTTHPRRNSTSELVGTVSYLPGPDQGKMVFSHKKEKDPFDDPFFNSDIPDLKIEIPSFKGPSFKGPSFSTGPSFNTGPFHSGPSFGGSRMGGGGFRF
jgi:hypothetical protein